MEHPSKGVNVEELKDFYTKSMGRVKYSLETGKHIVNPKIEDFAGNEFPINDWLNAMKEFNDNIDLEMSKGVNNV